MAVSENTTTILLAEDDAAERRLITHFLAREDYYVVEAATGSEALDYLREFEPDLIIADLRMPELDGIELLNIAKDEFSAIPFIIVSGVGTMEDVIHGLRLGAWDYLTKPIQPLELLLHSIKRVLEKAELLKNMRSHQEYLENIVQQRTADLLRQNKSYARELKRRQKMEEQARIAENEWRRTVDALPEMIAIIDKDRKITRVNKSMLTFLEKTEAELIGQCCFLCSSESACLHKACMKNTQPQTKELRFDKEGKDLELKIIPYNSVDGKWLGSIHVFRDITEIKKQIKEQKLRQSKALHSQKLESVGQLASGIAHEINTPTQFVSSNIAFFDEAFADLQSSINSIVKACSAETVSAETILTQLEEADWNYLEEEIPTAIQQSKEGLNRVSSIVRAMKEFSHPGDREAQEVDINNIIETTVTVARNEWKYVADVQLDLDPELPKISCLSDEMGQVILNLLVNSAHAIEDKLGETPEEDKGTITIATSQQPPWVVICISDTGVGMPRHVIEKIFEPFFTTKSTGKGTGQGLAIAYDVITSKHGGNIQVDSQTGKGTTFTIELPLSVK